MKREKVLYCTLLLCFFGLDTAQNAIANYVVLWNLPIEMCRLRNSRMVYERKTKNCAGSWIIQHKSWHLCLLL